MAYIWHSLYALSRNEDTSAQSVFRSAVLREFWINYVWLYHLRQITPCLTFKWRTLWHCHESLRDAVSYLSTRNIVFCCWAHWKKKGFIQALLFNFLQILFLFCFVFRLVSYISTTIHFSLGVILTETLEVLGNFILFFFLCSRFHVILPYVT